MIIIDNNECEYNNFRFKYVNSIEYGLVLDWISISNINLIDGRALSARQLTNFNSGLIFKNEPILHEFIVQHPLLLNFTEYLRIWLHNYTHSISFDTWVSQYNG